MTTHIIIGAARIIIGAAVVLLSACATFPKYEVPKKEYTVAVLPLYNETNDLDGPIMLRQMFDQKLRPYYRTAPLETVDEILRDQAGISLGGQLGMIKPQKLGQILGVDGLVYGYLLNFEDVKTVFYNVRKVRAAFKLVDVKTGKTVWARGQGVRSVGGMLDVVPADENLQEFMKIKDIEKIPGVNQWHDRVNIPSMIKEDPRSLFVIPFIAAADTVLSLVRHIAGNMAETHLYSFADEVTDRIVYEVVRVRYNLLDRPAEARKLIFPVLALYQDVDFTAKAILRVQNMSTGEESVSNLELKKKGCLLRSDRVAGENRFTLIVDSTVKKGLILFPESGQYTDLALNAASFEDVYIERAPLGEETVEGRLYDMFRLVVIYGDATIQEGVLWESKDRQGLIKRMRLRNVDSRMTLEIGDIATDAPSDDDFQVPSGYVRVQEQ
jgi:hypothetical protein